MAKNIAANVNGIDVFIETSETLMLPMASNEPLERGFGNNVKTKVEDSFVKAKQTIFGIAEEFGKELRIRPDMPDEVKFEFAFSLSSEANAWILTCRSSSSINVKLKWAMKEGK
ncbi:MAG: hypothetical protein LBK23_03020 [Oscillospiraceae bacterium]|nr:hypothetical protein [Oscillospiraceae bacterium]